MSKKVKLLSICKPKQYKTISKNELVEDGKYLVYGANGVIGKSNKYTHENRTLMVTCRGATCGSLNISKPFSYINGNAMAFDSIDKNFDLMYLYYYLSSRGFNDAISGTAQPQITRENLKNIDVLELSLEKQKQIAKTLDKAQELINLRKESIAKLDELAKSIFIDMFGDPVSNPKGWEVKKLKELSTHILSGNTPKGGSQVYVDNGILFFRSQNVWKNRIELDDIAYIDNETHSKMKKSSLKHKDILITKTGRINTENSSLGRASLFLGEDDSANINGHVYLVRLKKSMIHEFVLYILTTDEYRDYIRSVCVGAIDKRQINKVHLEEFPIIFPSIELQKKFASIANKIAEQKSLYEKELEKLEENFQALLQQSFKE